jgi:hypothetical protein
MTFSEGVNKVTTSVIAAGEKQINIDADKSPMMTSPTNALKNLEIRSLPAQGMFSNDEKIVRKK